MRSSSDPSLAGIEGAAAAALAHHWDAAQDLPRALIALVQAARHAKATYAPADAERHLERALEIWPRVPDARNGPASTAWRCSSSPSTPRSRPATRAARWR